ETPPVPVPDGHVDLRQAHQRGRAAVPALLAADREGHEGLRGQGNPLIAMQNPFEEHPCVDCGKPTAGSVFCVYHYLLKEYRYGVYDLKTNNKGFRRWATKRIYRYWRYVLLHGKS